MVRCPPVPKHLSHHRTLAIVVLAVFALPAWYGYQRLETQRPQLAFGLWAVFYVGVIVALMFIAGCAWYLALGPAGTPTGRVKAVLRRPADLAVPLMMSAAVVCAVVYFLRAMLW